MTGLTCRPNFFIVGAPKSGTTSLHYYLSQHPDIHMCRTKEPCFLAPDFKSRSYPQTETEYLSLFEGYQGQSRVGESTSTYLYSRLAARRIHEFAPEAKIIAILRNPADMVPSLHTQRLKEGLESIGNLKDALDAEVDRSRGKRMPWRFGYPKEYLLYRNVGRYAEQIARYLDLFRPDQLRIIIFDDFKDSPEHEFKETCRFLGVSSQSAAIDYSVQNPSRIPRSILAQRALRLAAPIINRIARRARVAIADRIRWKAWTWFETVLLKEEPVRIDADTRKLLLSYFAQETTELEYLLQKNLDAWRC